MSLFKKLWSSRVQEKQASELNITTYQDVQTAALPPAACYYTPATTNDIVGANPVVCVEPKNTTPFSCYRMSKRTGPASRGVLNVAIPVKRRKMTEELVEEEAGLEVADCNMESDTMLRLEAVVSPANQLNIENALIQNPWMLKQKAFLDMCTKHEAFLLRCATVDMYLLSMVLIYFERARLTPIGYTKDRYFFYALFLAMEMEEDAVDGLSDVVYYVVGPIPPRSSVPGHLSEAELKWNERLIKFYKGKDRFWARLNYRVFVSREDCIFVAQHFPKSPVLRRTRTIEDLQALKRF